MERNGSSVSAADVSIECSIHGDVSIRIDSELFVLGDQDRGRADAIERNR